MESEIEITVVIPRSVALALAQFCKRVGWNEIRVNAVDEAETYRIRDGISELQNGLAEAGFNPR